MFSGYLGFVTFDPTGSIGTFPSEINSAGEVVGTYETPKPGGMYSHGFVYAAGTITTFDVTGATDTNAVAINATGQITGWCDTNGFIDVAGAITTFDVAGAAFTTPVAINSAEEVAGSYYAGGNDHGFVYAAGTISTFDVPGAGNATPFCMNDAGQIAGYFGIGSTVHGFLDSAGIFTTLDPAGATVTEPKGINSVGVITGTYADAQGNYHGFIYDAGTFTTIDVPGSDHTVPESINDAGDVTGYYQFGYGPPHGFIDIAGTITTFDVPGAIATSPESINAADEITGIYEDHTGQQHGFIAAPCFCAGTHIATAWGELLVETLREGDRVLSAFGGAVPVVWIGRRHVDCRRHPAPRDVWPVCVRAGAFADATPARDLRLSPDHAVYIDGMLIPVRCLINGITITQEPVDQVSYYHVELPSHDVILAEGLAAESYLDTGNRAAFANGHPTRQAGAINLIPWADRSPSPARSRTP